MIIGGRDFNDGHTHVMGILNVTPDSFSDGGKYNNIDAALLHTKEMIEDGAHIIDIGGESTRPGYTMSRVASAAITSGADLINDIWGLKYDDDMAAVIAGSGLPCCIMHNRNNTDYSDFIKDLNKEMLESVNIALNAGIDRDKIIIDPGVGFGKEYIHNILCLRHLDEFCKLGYPVLLGTSRKSVIGLTLDLPKDERVEGTLVTTVIAVMNRCMFVRVHDVKQNYRTIKMTEGIYGRNSN